MKPAAIYLVRQPAFNNYRSFYGSLDKPETMEATSLRGEFSFKRPDDIRALGFLPVKVAAGLYKVEVLRSAP